MSPPPFIFPRVVPSAALEPRRHEVEEFLNACNPPMVEYLDAFMEFGCCNRAFLEAMGTWDGIKIHRAFDLIILEGHRRLRKSRGPTGMDLLVLEHHHKIQFSNHRI